MNLHAISTPKMLIACPSLDTACPNVPMMIIINSTPSISEVNETPMPKV